jgi:hypothetical protein
MGELFPLLGNWFWWVAAGVLLILELVAPGIFFIWLAIPAALTGFLDWRYDFGWQLELMIFAGLSVVSVFAGRKFLWKQRAFESDRPTLNQRMLDFVGRNYILDEAIVEGRGRLTIDSTIWEVLGPDAPRGSRVKVTGVDGLRLVVEPA